VKTVLHILTKPDDTLASIIVGHQAGLEDIRVEVADLTRPDADYEQLVERVFAADSIQVW
jgi:hypothetical protein